MVIVLEPIMQTVSVANAKAHLSALLDQVAHGEEITITRNGKAVATLHPVLQPRKTLDLARIDALRRSLPASEQTSTDLLRQLRESRY